MDGQERRVLVLENHVIKFLSFEQLQSYLALCYASLEAFTLMYCYSFRYRSNMSAVLVANPQQERMRKMCGDVTANV
jgi:hypothetical protein